MDIKVGDTCIFSLQGTMTPIQIKSIKAGEIYWQSLDLSYDGEMSVGYWQRQKNLLAKIEKLETLIKNGEIPDIEQERKSFIASLKEGK